ncbi:hypothetical protein FB451DRAFT_1184711 [Mycena latifolia]|nr:hypothetical protein FB451DRAFT_1184711 [Mycena latifolia]
MKELKQAAEAFCIRLAGSRHKLVGRSGPLFLEHLYRISETDGWINCDIISEWAQYLDDTTPDTKVMQNGFFNQIRGIYRLSDFENGKQDGKDLYWFIEDDKHPIIMPIHVPSHWICAFIDFEHAYLAIFDSLKSHCPGKDWKRSKHAEIFKMIQEWLQCVFLSWDGTIEWAEWTMDPCPENQPYQANGYTCGPHTCFLMSCLCNRQSKDMHQLNSIITADNVQKFRFKLFAHMMKLEQKPISEGENEEGLRDSDSDCKIFEDESLTSEGDSDIRMDAGNRSESPLTPILPLDPAPPVAPLRRSERNNKP